MERDSFCLSLLPFPMCLVLLTKAFKPDRIDINICQLTKPCKQFSDRYHAQELEVYCHIARQSSVMLLFL